MLNKLFHIWASVSSSIKQGSKKLPQEFLKGRNKVTCKFSAQCLAEINCSSNISSSFFLSSSLISDLLLPGAHSLSRFNHCHRWVLWFQACGSCSWFLSGTCKRIRLPIRGWLKALLGLFPPCLAQSLRHYQSNESRDQCQTENWAKPHSQDWFSHTHRLPP